jgi:hypothetical protein
VFSLQFSARPLRRLLFPFGTDQTLNTEPLNNSLS